MVVLGVDPGENVTGFCVIEKIPGGQRWINGGRIESPKGTSLPTRLLAIYKDICGIIGDYKPEEVAVEAVVHAKNVRSTVGMAHVRGVIALAAAEAGLEVFEYAPTDVKKSVVGNGAASKEQVQYMVKRILKLDRALSPDEADALAVGLCHLQKASSAVRKAYGSLAAGAVPGRPGVKAAGPSARWEARLKAALATREPRK